MNWAISIRARMVQGRRASASPASVVRVVCAVRVSGRLAVGRDRDRGVVACVCARRGPVPGRCGATW